jgi:hypothetical protein
MPGDGNNVFHQIVWFFENIVIDSLQYVLINLTAVTAEG